MPSPSSPQPPPRPDTKRAEAAERQVRQKEHVIATQVDLKREAAERRALKEAKKS